MKIKVTEEKKGDRLPKIWDNMKQESTKKNSKNIVSKEIRIEVKQKVFAKLILYSSCDQSILHVYKSFTFK